MILQIPCDAVRVEDSSGHPNILATTCRTPSQVYLESPHEEDAAGDPFGFVGFLVYEKPFLDLRAEDDSLTQAMMGRKDTAMFAHMGPWCGDDRHQLFYQLFCREIKHTPRRDTKYANDNYSSRQSPPTA